MSAEIKLYGSNDEFLRSRILGLTAFIKFCGFRLRNNVIALPSYVEYFFSVYKDEITFEKHFAVIHTTQLPKLPNLSSLK